MFGMLIQALNNLSSTVLSLEEGAWESLQYKLQHIRLLLLKTATCTALSFKEIPGIRVCLSNNLVDLLFVEKYCHSSEEKDQYCFVLQDLCALLQKFYCLPNNPAPFEHSINLVIWLETTLGSTQAQACVSSFLTRLKENLEATPELTYTRYQDIRLLAHKLGIEGTLEVQLKAQTLSIPLEGYDVFYTLEALCHSFETFLQHPDIGHNNIPQSVLKDCLSALKMAYQVKKAWLSPDILEKVKSQYDHTHPIVLLSGIYNHNINYIFMNNICGYMNRGLLADRDRYGSLFYTFEKLEVIQPTFISNVLSRSNTHILEKDNSLAFFNTQLKEQLALDRKAYFHQKAKQMKGGHCAWANVKQTLPSLLTLCFIRHSPHLTEQEAFQQIKPFYKRWSQWDRTRTLKGFINKYPTSAIECFLFSRIIEQHHDIQKPAEVERGRLMLAVMPEAQKRRLAQTEAVRLFMHTCERDPSPLVFRRQPTSFRPSRKVEHPNTRCCVVL